MQNQQYTKRRATQSFRKIYLSLYSKGLCVRRSWRPNRTATYWPPLLWPWVLCFSCSPGLLNRRHSARCWLSLLHLVTNESGLQTGLVSNWSGLQTRLILNCNCSIGGLRAHSAGCWSSLPHLISNWSGLQTNWLPVFTELYIISSPPSSCGRHNCTHSTHPRSRL